MQRGHLVFLVTVVVYLQEAPFVSEKLVDIRLFLDVVDEELDEHASLALVDDGVRQLGEIRGKRVSRYLLQSRYLSLPCSFSTENWLSSIFVSLRW